MTYPYVKILGDLDSGLVIEAYMPSNLGERWQCIVLTPAQSAQSNYLINQIVKLVQKSKE